MSPHRSALRDTGKDLLQDDSAFSPFMDSSPFPGSRSGYVHGHSGSLASRIGKGALAGAAAGLAAGLVMNLFQQAWTKSEESMGGGNAGLPKHRTRSKKTQDENEDATVKVAQTVIKPVIGRKLRKKEKQVAGPVVHFAFSAAMGALYGAMAEVLPLTNAGFGTAFGTALFVGADELAVPMLGLGPSMRDAPIGKHAFGLVSHWVWGAATEGGRRGIIAGLEKL